MYMGKDEKEDEPLFYLYAAKSAVSKQKCEKIRENMKQKELIFTGFDNKIVPLKAQLISHERPLYL